MLDLIKEILDKNKSVNGYEIVESKVQSNELFLIKNNVDMDRAKKVHNFNVVVYKDIDMDGKKYTGVAATSIHPTMSRVEIEAEIEEAIFAAEFAKNEYYPLVKAGQSYSELEASSFSKEKLSYWTNEITKAIYKNDIYDQGGINSSEVFLDKIYTRVVNSEGIDVSFENYASTVEIITTWKGEKEEIELYDLLEFSNFDEAYIAEEVDRLLNISKERAIAVATPSLKEVPVLLTHSSVPKLLDYYYFKSTAAAVYNKQSTFKVSDNLQGDNVKGDLITLKLEPLMKNSTSSAPFSNDGLPLVEATIIEKGVLKNYIANNKYGYYLKVNPTGDTKNVSVSGGSKSLEEFKQSPYLEIAAFSDFTMDELTGNFGGEIRLGWYYDGIKRIPVTGGSISGNITKLQEEMYLSKELEKNNNYIYPKAIKLIGVSIAGV